MANAGRRARLFDVRWQRRRRRWSRSRTIDFNYETKEHFMTWETPTAINFRYGFEITLYIANR